MKTMYFFDDWILRNREGLDRKLGQPERKKEIVSKFHPELSMIRGGLGVRYDRRLEKYVTHVDCTQRSDGTRFFVLVESDDPFTWPDLKWSAGKGPLWTRVDNVIKDQYGNPLCCFNVLSLLDTPLEEKGYFMNLYRYKNKEGIESAATAFSQDGIHYEVDDKVSWVPYFSDTGNPTSYDPRTGEFITYCRPGHIDRRVAMVTSTDLKHFSEPTVILQPDIEDPVCREFYGMDSVNYGDISVGVVSVYDSEPTEKKRTRMEGTAETHLTYSYNGRNWYRAGRTPFIPRTGAGSDFGGSVYASPPLRLPDNRLLINVMGNAVEHGVDGEDVPDEWKTTWKTFQYDMRLDGFVYLRTRARLGMIRTKTVVPDGGDLTVNTRTAISGYVKAAVLDEKTLEPLPNYSLEDSLPVTGDELFGSLRWRNRKNLDELKGKPVVIEVQVREGELYSLGFSYTALFCE